MSSNRPSGIRPPSVIPTKIPSSTPVIPLGSGVATGSTGSLTSGIPKPSNYGHSASTSTTPSSPAPNMMRFGRASSTANSSPVPCESPVNMRYPDTPQSGQSQKEMDSWNSNGDASGYGYGARRGDEEVLTEDTDSFIIGDVVWVGGQKRGKIAFIGETHFAKGEWAGVALDAPFGKNDGTVNGIRYFQCEPNHGTFTRLTRLTRQPLATYDGEDCFVHGTTPPRYLSDFRRSPSPYRSKSPSPGPMTPRLGSPAPSIKVGERVIVQSSSGTKRGLLRYLGPTMFATGEWAGIELDMPVGKNDGSVGGHRYFSCPDKYGLFAPVSKVSSSPANRLMSARKHGSRESMLSNLSSVPSSSAPRALRSVLLEKERHLEQLLKERDLDMGEVAQANREYEDRIEELQDIRASLIQNHERTEKELATLTDRMQELEAENRSLKVSLEEERREHEDLLFRFEEDKINQADLQARLCSSEAQEGDNDELIALKLIAVDNSEKLKRRETELNLAQEKLSKSNKRAEEVGAEKILVSQQLAKVTAELEDCRKQVRSLEESLAGEILHSQHAIAALERAHAHKISEMANYGEKVESLSATVISLENQLELERGERNKLESQVTQNLIEGGLTDSAVGGRLASKDEEIRRLMNKATELQQINSSLLAVWEGKLKLVQDSFKTKEESYQNTIKELRQLLATAGTDSTATRSANNGHATESNLNS